MFIFDCFSFFVFLFFQCTANVLQARRAAEAKAKAEQQRLQRQQQHPKTLHQRGVEAIAQIPSAGVITPELDHAERVAAPGQLLSDSV